MRFPWSFFRLILFASALAVSSAGAQLAPVFRQGAEPIFIPSEMPPVIRTWHPSNSSKEPGIKHGPPFEAALVRVFNEDTDWTSEIAVFRFRDGTARAWKSKSFSSADRAIMTQMKAKAPVPQRDLRRWTTKLDDNIQKLVDEKQLNKYETAHFVFIWGNDIDGVELQRIVRSPGFIQRAGEWFEKVWNAYEVDFQAPMPYMRDPKPRRIVVNLYGTGIPGLTGGNGWANSAKSMALSPRAMLYGSTVVPHEFGHVMQAYTGGYMIRPSGGPWWETNAEVGSFNFAPNQADKLPVMFENLTHGCQWPDSRYSNWAILMQMWEKKRLWDLVYGIWPKNKRDDGGASLEDPIETTVRLGLADRSLPKGWDSWGEEIGEMAARMVTMDYINQGFLADVSAELREKTMSKVSPDPKAAGWFNAPADKKLYAYGIQWIPVKPTPGALQFAVTFRGASSAPDAKWRITLVAVGKGDVARYSPRVTAVGKAEVKVSMDVKPNERYVLAIAATPTTYRSLTWNQTPDYEYPYAVRARNATFAADPAKP